MTHAANDVRPPIDDPHASLERALIAEYLNDRGYTVQAVRALPMPQQQDLLRAAASYATLRMSEIESRARYVDEIG